MINLRTMLQQWLDFKHITVQRFAWEHGLEMSDCYQLTDACRNVMLELLRTESLFIAHLRRLGTTVEPTIISTK